MSEPRLCVTVTAATTAELRARRDAVMDADLVELRLDSVRDPDVAGALAGRRRAVIVTCRPEWEGGTFRGSEEERRRILADALAGGAEYVDLEWRGGFADLIARAAGRRIVLSMHDFEGVPTDLPAQLQAMRATGAEVVKVAINAKRLSDCVPLLHLGSAGNDQGLIAIAMGEHGIATRILASRFGSKWAYAGIIRELGQLTAQSLLNDYRFRSIGDSTAIYGVVGGSVAHSVSPAMHNAAFAAAHIDAVYLPFPAVDADDIQTFGRALGISGASVTIPHKVSLLNRVDELEAMARRAGAINTIKVVDDRWIGGNTDAAGFLAPLQDRVPLRGLRAAVLGAGGAARAVTAALTSSGCAKVTVHARDRARAEQLAALTPVDVASWPPEPGTWDLLINCTPVGTYPRVDDTPIPASLLTGQYVYDLIYNPPTTRLLREAAAAGCQTIGGLEMLVAQAQEQFRWWIGTNAPRGVMRDAALRRLAEFVHDEHYVV